MSSSTHSSNYRPEIQGIRTIGALLVAVFHIWGGRVSGGVDVFFVISGFLITGSLYREIQKTGTIGIFAFWGRIAKRVAPMAYFVLMLTLIAAAFWMPQTQQAELLSEVFYSAVHLENLKLMVDSVDYLAREEAPSAVQQFWALSVQVQFYAIWPFLLLAVAFMARRARSAWIAPSAALATVLLGSLAYSIIATTWDPAPAYFDTFARVWEFALGGLLAIALPRLSLAPILCWLAGWIGLFLVISCGFLLPKDAAFPGYVSLWPTLGAALVLVSSNHRSSFGVDRILASRPLVALGDISFSFYLWHWPVLIFAMLIVGRTRLDLWTGLAVIAIALCGAYGAHRWIEQPIQRSAIGKARTWHVHAMAVGLAIPVLMFSGIWKLVHEGAEVRKETSFTVADYPGGRLPASIETILSPGVPVHPAPKFAKRDHARVYRDKCHQKYGESAVIACDYGTLESPTKTIALVGGSHSAHWLPALEVLAQEYGWRIVSITKSSCLLDASDFLSRSCVEWNRSVVEHLDRLKPDVIFTTSTRVDSRIGAVTHSSDNSLPSKREYIPDGFLKQWSQLAGNALSVIAVRDNPRFSFRIPECVEQNSGDLLRCARHRNRLLGDVDPALNLQPKPTNVDFIDLTDRFCDSEWCFPVSGSVVVYSDKHHITATFSRTLAPTLGERMRLVRPDLFHAAPAGEQSKQKSAATE